MDERRMNGWIGKGWLDGWGRDGWMNEGEIDGWRRDG